VEVDARLPEVEQLLLDQEALPLEEVLEARRPVWETKPFFSWRFSASRSIFSVSALRLTISSRTETRSRRCSSRETASSDVLSSYVSEAPETTRSLLWHFAQNSRSSSLVVPQT
jgi:hypothetical protein